MTDLILSGPRKSDGAFGAGLSGGGIRALIWSTAAAAVGVPLAQAHKYASTMTLFLTRTSWSQRHPRFCCLSVCWSELNVTTSPLNGPGANIFHTVGSELALISVALHLPNELYAL